MLRIVKIIPSTITLLSKYNSFKVTTLIKWHTAVIQEIVVKDPIHTSLFIQKINVLAQTDAVHKCHLKTFDYLLFLFGELVYILQIFCRKIDCRESLFFNVIFPSVNFHRLTRNIDLVKQKLSSIL